MKRRSKTQYPARRRKVPRDFEDLFPPTRILRPFEKWLLGLFSNERWVDSRVSFEWLDSCRTLAKSLGCGLRFDVQRHWRESVYVTDYRGQGPTVLAGGAGNPKFGCTVILHELGHHVLLSQERSPKGQLAEEEAAWNIAMEFARLHRLPWVSTIKRQSLYSYRLGALLQENSGSKRRNKHRPLPKSWRLELSKRTAASSIRMDLYSMGKKGRRHAKRLLKRQAARAERRRSLHDE